ncbi:hypothetical protein D3C81_1894570 [compost metagenome]
MSGIGHDHGRTGVTFWADLREEHIFEITAIDAFDKQHRAAVSGLLELSLRECRHAGVRFRFRQHFVLML